MCSLSMGTVSPPPLKARVDQGLTHIRAALGISVSDIQILIVFIMCQTLFQNTVVKRKPGSYSHEADILRRRTENT